MERIEPLLRFKKANGCYALAASYSHNLDIRPEASFPADNFKFVQLRQLVLVDFEELTTDLGPFTRPVQHHRPEEVGGNKQRVRLTEADGISPIKALPKLGSRTKCRLMPADISAERLPLCIVHYSPC